MNTVRGTATKWSLPSFNFQLSDSKFQAPAPQVSSSKFHVPRANVDLFSRLMHRTTDLGRINNPSFFTFIPDLSRFSRETTDHKTPARRSSRQPSLNHAGHTKNLQLMAEQRYCDFYGFVERIIAALQHTDNSSGAIEIICPSHVWKDAKRKDQCVLS